MAAMNTPENAGEGIVAKNASWSFGNGTSEHFDNHVRRSVPFYDAGHDLLLRLSDFFVRPDSHCYDLGTSTGTLLRKLAKRHSPNTKWIGIDLEPEMIKKATSLVSPDEIQSGHITFTSDDIVTYPYEQSDFIVSYYTVQFVSPRVRQYLLNKVYTALNWGGAFLMFEKVRASDARFQDLTSSLYQDFKLQQGYTPDEIIAKSRSLKGILEPFSTQGNMDLLRRAGFVDIISIYKYVCFEGFLCIK